MGQNFGLAATVVHDSFSWSPLGAGPRPVEAGCFYMLLKLNRRLFGVRGCAPIINVTVNPPLWSEAVSVPLCFVECWARLCFVGVIYFLTYEAMFMGRCAPGPRLTSSSRENRITPNPMWRNLGWGYFLSLKNS